MAKSATPVRVRQQPPEVADDGAGVAGQYVPGVDVVARTFASVHRGQELGGGGVDVLQAAVGADRALVDVQDPDVAQQSWTRGRNSCSSSRAARPRTPAMNPVEGVTPSIKAISLVAWATGR